MLVCSSSRRFCWRMKHIHAHESSQPQVAGCIEERKHCECMRRPQFPFMHTHTHATQHNFIYCNIAHYAQFRDARQRLNAPPPPILSQGMICGLVPANCSVVCVCVCFSTCRICTKIYSACKFDCVCFVCGFQAGLNSDVCLQCSFDCVPLNLSPSKYAHSTEACMDLRGSHVVTNCTPPRSERPAYDYAARIYMIVDTFVVLCSGVFYVCQYVYVRV